MENGAVKEKGERTQGLRGSCIVSISHLSSFCFFPFRFLFAMDSFTQSFTHVLYS